jgi:hypothetical protein
MRIKIIAYAALNLLLSNGGAFAQNPNDIMNIFGGMMQSAMVQATRAQWNKLPSNEIACVDQTLRQRRSSIEAQIRQGITPSDARVADVRSICRNQIAPQPAQTMRTDAQTSRYSVDGLALGAQVRFDSAVYQGYQCAPSDQFADLTWCQRKRVETEARGQFTSSTSILHSADGTAFYVNHSLEPAFFTGNEAKEEIDRLAKKYGTPSRIIPMPQRSSVPYGMIALWGNVVLEPLDASSVNQLAAGRDVRRGFLIDHIGNFQRSAQLGLPIYRISGGAGYVWAASYDQSGRGILRFLTIDASAIARSIQPAAQDASAELVQRRIAEARAAQRDAEEAAKQAEAAAAQRVAEAQAAQRAAEESARKIAARDAEEAAKQAEAAAAQRVAEAQAAQRAAEESARKIAARDAEDSAKQAEAEAAAAAAAAQRAAEAQAAQRAAEESAKKIAAYQRQYEILIPIVGFVILAGLAGAVSLFRSSARRKAISDPTVGDTITPLSDIVSNEKHVFIEANTQNDLSETFAKVENVIIPDAPATVLRMPDAVSNIEQHNVSPAIHHKNDLAVMTTQDVRINKSPDRNKRSLDKRKSVKESEDKAAADIAPVTNERLSDTNDVVDQLAKFAELRANGTLTDEEFAEIKAKLIGPSPSKPLSTNDYIKHLRSLRDNGDLTAEEFQSKVLASLSDSSSV